MKGLRGKRLSEAEIQRLADDVELAARDNAWETEGLPRDAGGNRDTSAEFAEVVRNGVEMIAWDLTEERGEYRAYRLTKPLSYEDARRVSELAAKRYRLGAKGLRGGGGLRGRLFDTSYGNDECTVSSGAVTEKFLFRAFDCKGVPGYERERFHVWRRDRPPSFDFEDARDAVVEMAGSEEPGEIWDLVLWTNDKGEFDEYWYGRVKGMRGLQGLRGKKRSRGGARPDMVGTRELELYADNEEPLYRQKRSIEQNLVRKLAAGKYSREKAVKLWRYYADAAAKRYMREFGSSGSAIFSKAERDALAKREERQFFARVKASDPDLLVFVPKKYKKSKLCEVRRTNGTFKLDCNITLHGLSSRRRRR